MRAPASLRVRMTLACVGLVVSVTTVVLLTSWNLLDHHLERTLPPALAGAVSERVATQYAIAVLGAGLIALGVAWAGAGRILAPVRAIGVTARRVTDLGTDARVGLGGGRDELHDLAETFDAMLDRVQGAAAAQRRFVANASHELRTPMTVIRAEAEVALDDPDASVGELRDALRAILDTGERTELLLDALLVLATSTEGVPRQDDVDLVTTARRALAPLAGAVRCGHLDDVHVRGNAALLERLVGNLAENAVRHGSDPEIELRAGADAATIVVRNGGARIPPDVLARLSDPFERGNRTRGSGVGLGLSIVRAIAESHGGTLALRAPDRGGLQAEVRLPIAGVTRT
jgi:signal transduction histidine kinase